MTPHTHEYYAGALLWVLSLQYYVAQIIVAAAWQLTGFSWQQNTISDLANTSCGLYSDRLVCSPLHNVMNISFIVLGLTMISGAYLLARRLALGRMAKVGFGCMALAGAGTILVGIFPENTISYVHIIGAALPFLLGNIGMIIIGSRLTRLPKWLRIYTIVSGILGLVALILLLKSVYLGLELGGMERVVAYPQSIWMIVFGAYLLTRRPYTKEEI